MTRYSLRWRLLVGAAVAVFAALALAWVAMTLLFQRHLELRVEEGLRLDGLQLVADLGVDSTGMITLMQLPTDPRFGVPSGGLYWQITAGQQMQRSRSLWDQALPSSPQAETTEWRSRTIDDDRIKLALRDRDLSRRGLQQPLHGWHATLVSTRFVLQNAASGPSQAIAPADPA